MKSLAIVSRGLAPYRVRFYQETAHILRKSGWRVVLLVATEAAKDHPWENLRGGNGELEIVNVGTRMKFPNRRFDLPSIALVNALELANPSVVWTHEYSPFCLAAALWARLRSRHSLLSTEIGDNPPPYACSRFQVWAHGMAADLYHGVIAQTREATRRGRPEGVPILFAPHAVSTEEYSPGVTASGRTFRFLFTGSLDSRKGIKRVVMAGRLLAGEGWDFELRVLGSGPLASWLREQPDAWISYAGFQEGAKLRHEYRNAAAYVLPTRGDTYAVTVHEAAASGLPLIVGTQAGAVETLVEEGVTGFSVEADNIAQIADSMREFLRHPEKARMMGLQARKLSLEYDVALLGRRAADFIKAFHSA